MNPEATAAGEVSGREAGGGEAGGSAVSGVKAGGGEAGGSAASSVNAGGSVVSGGEATKAHDDDVRFENRFPYTAKTLRPVYRKLTPLWLQSLYALWVAIGLAVLPLLDSDIGKAPVLALLLVLLGLNGLFVKPYLLAREAARNHSKLTNDRKSEAIVRFTDSEIAGQEARNRSFYTYNQIRSVRSTRRMWLLMIDKRIALMVSKDGFTKGHSADFPAYIRSKCPGIKGTFK